MHFGFSYIGMLFLIMLMAPNLFWTKNQPQNYREYVKNENHVLRLLERVGQIAVTCIVLIFRDFNIENVSWRLLFLGCAFLCMLLYEVYWIRYFKSEKTMRDFYRDLCGIPVAGATLPVVAFFLLAIYGKNPFLAFAVCVLGVGHIGIHLSHYRECIDQEG